MHPLRGEGAITAPPQWPLGAHRYRGRPRRADQGIGGRARRNIRWLLTLTRSTIWILTTNGDLQRRDEPGHHRHPGGAGDWSPADRSRWTGRRPASGYIDRQHPAGPP